ncbi:MAG TPA: hypothetical protein VNA65_00105 [Candidatus Dormibacteraeota bacterium]|nr:hypothetical protein [Candidatus Dormibacteraeota bacterium]
MSNYSPLLALFALAPRLRRASNRAVSVYLPARSEGYDARFYDIEFRDLLHRYHDRLSPKDRELMEYEMRRIRNHVAVVRPSGGPAFAGFGDEPRGVLELVKLRAETDERLEVGELLFAPIFRQLEQFPPSLVAVVDKEHAKLFGAILDDVIPLEQVDGAEVRHSRAGGTSASSNQRKADNKAKANLEAAVKSVEREMSSGAYVNLYVAGPEEARATFERMLPDRLKKSVAGHVTVSLDSSELKRDLREKMVKIPAKSEAAP